MYDNSEIVVSKSLDAKPELLPYIPELVADLLAFGIVTDSGHFAVASPGSFKAMSELLELGDRDTVNIISYFLLNIIFKIIKVIKATIPKVCASTFRGNNPT